MKSSGRTMALALALTPLGAAAAGAQQTPTRSPVHSRTQICVNGQCMDDSSSVVALRLMTRVDSLQRIFLGQPIPPEQRDQMKAQIQDMLHQLAQLQRNVIVFGLQQADEATRQADEAMRQAMSGSAAAVLSLQTAPQAMAEARPKGWIGITLVGAPVEDVRDGEYFVRFLDYPEVESVEPSSPAEQAGILHGDLLVAYNGQDVTTHTISMTRLFQPDHKVMVRLERNGQDVEYPLIVARAPQTYAMRSGDFSAPKAVLDMPDVPPPPPPAAGLMPTPMIVRRAAPSAPGAPRAGSAFYMDDLGEHAPVIGAQMNALNSDLAQNLHLGADHGVMVINAPAGSPAARAGLQNGDIITRAAGDEVSSVRELRRALERHSSEAAVELQIVRDRHTRTVKISND